MPTVFRHSDGLDWCHRNTQMSASNRVFFRDHNKQIEDVYWWWWWRLLNMPMWSQASFSPPPPPRNQLQLYEEDLVAQNSRMISKIPLWDDQLHSKMIRQYLTWDEIQEYLWNVATRHKHIAHLQEIGRTFEGRQINVLRISSGINSAEYNPRKPIVWLDAGIHPREWISISTALYIIHQLITGYETDVLTTYLVSNFEWHILPVVNPDGYAYSWTTDRMWRKNRSRQPGSNCIGVDLNRNFEQFFAERGPPRRRSSYNPCHDENPGLYPFSELETQAIHRWLFAMKNHVLLFIQMHSYDQLWMLPYGQSQLKPKHYKEMMRMAELAVKAMKSHGGGHYRIGTIAELSGSVNGGSIDWVYSRLGVKFAFAVELRDTGQYGFLLPPNQIIPTGREMWAAIRTITLSL